MTIYAYMTKIVQNMRKKSHIKQENKEMERFVSGKKELSIVNFQDEIYDKHDGRNNRQKKIRRRDYHEKTKTF